MKIREGSVVLLKNSGFTWGQSIGIVKRINNISFLVYIVDTERPYRLHEYIINRSIESEYHWAYFKCSISKVLEY